MAYFIGGSKRHSTCQQTERYGAIKSGKFWQDRFPVLQEIVPINFRIKIDTHEISVGSQIKYEFEGGNHPLYFLSINFNGFIILKKGEKAIIELTIETLKSSFIETLHVEAGELITLDQITGMSIDQYVGLIQISEINPYRGSIIIDAFPIELLTPYCLGRES